MNASLWAIVAVFVVLGLALLFLMLNVFLDRRNTKLTLGVMVAGLFGVVLGWGAFYGGVSMTGQQMEFSVSGFEGEMVEMPTEADPPQQAGAEGAPGGGGGMPGMGGGGMPGMGGGGMPGMGGGGGRGGRTPSSRRGLTTLVRKLDLLTGDISVKFSTKQASEIGELLAKATGGEKMTDEQAKEALEAVEAALSDEQKAALERVGLPRRRRSGGGGGGFGGFGGGGGGNQAPADENPFTEEDNHTALVSLLKRHGVTPPKITVKKSQERPARPQTAEGGGGAGGAAGGRGAGKAAGGGDNSTGNVIEAILKQHDKDGDGALSKEEAPEFLRNRFDRIDTNKDGKCDLKEMTAARRLSPAG